MSELLDCVIVDPSDCPKSSVIWCHGLGADGHDFESLVPYLEVPPELNTRFVFPHAPIQPVTLNGGAPMRAWFDVYELAFDAKQDEYGIRESQAAIEKLIAREKSLGIPAKKIVVAGFSQGGALALQVGLRYEERLAGIMVLSSFLPLEDSLADERSDLNNNTPIFMAHGRHDPVVPIAWGERSLEKLKEMAYEPKWRQYPVDHSISPQEVLDIGAWLGKVLQ